MNGFLLVCMVVLSNAVVVMKFKSKKLVSGRMHLMNAGLGIASCHEREQCEFKLVSQ